MGVGSSAQRPIPEAAEEWEDQTFHHEYDQQAPVNWDEEDNQEASVSIHLGPRLVRRLQQRRGGSVAAGGRVQRQERPARTERKEEADLDFDATLPPPLSEEELDSLVFATPQLPPLLTLADDEEGVPFHEEEQQRIGAKAHHPTTTAADRELARREADALRQQYRAEQERLHDEGVEQLHKLRSLLDSMTRHRRASGDSCEAERSACLECYAKERDPLSCASRVRAFKQCATVPKVP